MIEQPFRAPTGASLFSVALASMVLAAGAAAQPRPSAAAVTAAWAERDQVLREQPSFDQLQVPGNEVRAGVRRALTELTWHRTLAQATSAARLEGKPIVWVQALGDLRGLT